MGSCYEMQICRNTNSFHLLMGNIALLKAECLTLGLAWTISLDLTGMKKLEV